MSKQLLGILVATMLVTNGQAFQTGDESPKSRDYRFTAGTSALRIPFEEDDGHIFLQLRINDSGPLWFGLDTGAIRSVIDKRTATELGLRFEGTQRVGGAGGVVEASLVKRASIKLPGAEIRDQTLWAMPLDFLAAVKGRAVHGILGYELFNRFVVDIDYDNRLINLFEPQTYAYRGSGQSIPITFQDNESYVHATITVPGREPIAGQFVLDTGGGGTLLLTKTFVANHQLLKSVGRTIPARGGGVGGQIQLAMGRLPQVHIGRFAVRNPLTGFIETGEVAATGKAGNIGARRLRRFHVIFDYSRKRMILEPSKYFDEADELDMSGAALAWEGTTLRTIRVTRVRPESPATEAGLQPQDVIVQIDDQPATSLTPTSVKSLFRQDGKHRTLTVKRGDQVLQLRLKLRRLI